jgi:hypothetical protein
MAVEIRVFSGKPGREIGIERRACRGRHELAQAELPRAETLTPWLVCALVALGFALFIGYSWSGYGARFAQAGSGFQAGATRLVELTVIREDVDNLACASDVTSGGLRCGYTGGRTLIEPRDDARTLQPYYTVTGELLLGAGLWSSKALPAALPAQRFTVACNYHVTGVLKSAALRWAVAGKFDPLAQSVVIGSLNDCAIPQ